jgi:hypothetical protein
MPIACARQGFVMKLKSLGAQILICAALAVSAIAFGAGAAHAALGALPAHARPAPVAGPVVRPGFGSWPGGPFVPYVPYAPSPPIDSADEGQGASGGEATWPPTDASWPPGGGSGAADSQTPIVMPSGQ